ASERDDRPSARLRLEGDEPEVLLLGEDQGAAPGIELREPGVGHVPEEPHVRGRAPLELAPARTVAGDDERAVESPERLNDEVLALVGDESADEEIRAVVAPAARTEEVEVHRRVD